MIRLVLILIYTFYFITLSIFLFFQLTTQKYPPSLLFHKTNKMLRRKSSSNLIENRHVRQWSTLFSAIVDINERTYTKCGKDVIIKLQSLVQNDVVNSSKVTSTAILYLLYERALQELLFKTFPVSGSLINSLTSSSSEDIFNKIQPIIQEHLQRLQSKLSDTANINGMDVGVICILLSIYRLEKMAGQESHVVSVLENIIKEVSEYLELVSFEKKLENDALVILLYALVWFSQSSNSKEVNMDKIKTFVRRGHIKFHRTMTMFGRTLLLDTVEHMQCFDYNIKLYVTSYKKIMGTQKYLLSGIEDYVRGTPFPSDGSESLDDLMSDSMVALSTQSSVEADDVFQGADSPLSSSVPRMEPEGSSGSDEDLKREIYQARKSFSSSEELDAHKWDRKISQESKPADRFDFILLFINYTISKE